MNIKDNSIVGTIIDYANVKFGMEIKPEEISAQLKDLSFSDTLRLVDAIKNENDELFSSIIDLSALSESGAGYGTSATGPTSSVAGMRDQDANARNDARRDTNLALKANRSAGPARTVAGANKQPTAVPSRPQQDPEAAQVAQNANQSASNAQEIERLKQLIKGTR